MVHRGGALTLALVLLLGLLLATGTAVAAPSEDPETDVIGWERGYWHNESIDVDQSDGLSDAELDAVVGRASARLEILRDREFNGTVPVEVIDRASYGNETSGNASDDYRAWNNQVWEALFIVGEDEDVQDVLQSTATSQTTGAYFFERDEIRIITDSPDSPSISRGTIVHELVHAQQDQYVNLSSARFSPHTQDEQLASNGLIEGEANYLEDRYQERCGAEWECVPNAGGGGGGGDIHFGVYAVLIHPYSDGPPYVHEIVEREGWAGVDARFVHPPNTTEQIIHRTDEPPARLVVEDNATNGWQPFPEQGRNGTDTAGEASMFSMFWYQARNYGADTVDVGSFVETDSPYDIYDYNAPPSAGWANDAILPYWKQTMGGRDYGYVWATTWDTRGDAQSFEATYLEILSAHDARRVGTQTWVIDTGPYADAFRVVRDGRNVTIVNAPHSSDLEDVRPGLDEVEPTPTPSQPPPETPTPPTETATPVTEPTEPTSTDGQPGFGLVGIVLAFGLVVALGSRR